MQGTMQIESSQHNLETFPTVKTILFTEGKKKNLRKKKKKHSNQQKAPQCQHSSLRTKHTR